MSLQNTPIRRHTDGTAAGDPIPGSKLYRAFCPKCKEPIRFSAASPEEAKKRAGGKHCSEGGDHFTPVCQECMDDGPRQKSCVSLDDLIHISNNRPPDDMPRGELILSGQKSWWQMTREIYGGHGR